MTRRLPTCFFLLAALVVLRGATAAGGPQTPGYAGQTPPGMVPAVFAPGLVSTERAESAPAFSPDGREFYFSRADQNGRREILVSRVGNGAWTAPSRLPFSDPRFDDSKATLASDGRSLVFASNRPVAGLPAAAPNFLNLWISNRTGEGWSEPRPLGPEINTASDEDFPSVSADGTLWFVSNRAGRPDQYRIYRSRMERGQFAPAQLFTSPIDSGSGEAVCHATADGRRLLVMSMRSGGAGAIDLYVARRGVDGSPGPAVNLGPAVNSPHVDWFATLTPDGRYLFFASTRSGNGDIYWVDAKVIDQALATPRPTLR